jgi:aminocarboxymuconate-semialdehyde decarboxylase
MQITDIHAHWFAPEWLALLEREADANGAKMGRNAHGDRTITLPGVALVSSFPRDMVDVATMIANMDAARVDLRLFSLTNPMINWAPPEFGAKLARAYNDACVEAHRAHPQRFIGALTLPMQAPELAVKELERAARLPGMRAVYMAMHINGRNLDDKSFWPVYEKIEALGLPLCLHPVNPCCIERLRSYHMRNLVGNPHEAAIAAGDLIFGGVLDAFPKLDVVLPHAGGSFPWLIGRFDNGVATRKRELGHMTQAASRYLRRFYYDTISHHPQIMRFLIELAGADRIMVGSDYNMDAGYPRPVEFVESIPGLTGEERDLILGANAARVFGL